MLRIGQGIDVHQLTSGRKLILCGVEIPHKLGLAGHSDADVATHALMDALLGAAALGDIGKLFPDTDDAYLGANSLKLLESVCSLLSENHYTIVNTDLTIIAQKPKISPYTDSMRQKLAETMKIPMECVSIKATTTEHLGYEGEEKGITAHCICMLER